MATRTDRPNAGTYRRQLIAMLDDETADRIEREATEPGQSKAGVIRRYLELGIKRHDALERAKGKPDRDAETHARRVAHVTGADRLDGPLDGPAD